MVLGLDPGLAITGWALVEGGGGRLTLRDAGGLRTPAGVPDHLRLLRLAELLSDLLATAAPDAAAVEKLYFSRNVSTAMAVSQARGVLLCGLASRGLEVAEYTPGEIKQAVTGSGSADKGQVARMVRLLLGHQLRSSPDDVTDACAISICHHHASGLRRAVAAGLR